MCLAHAAAFVNYTYELILIVLSIYSNDFLNWAAETNDLSIKIKFSLISITGILMAICLLYNLARWYLIIKIMKRENEALSRNFRFTINILTAILALFGISQTTIIIIDSI
jgi:magnesium-transporting ATPase (P-type)